MCITRFYYNLVQRFTSLCITGLYAVSLYAQDSTRLEKTTEALPQFNDTYTVTSKTEWSDNWYITADLLNRWNWRGVNSVTGAVIQPEIGFTYGGFSLSVWANFSISDNRATEFDTYLGYESPFGLTIEVNDFFAPIEKDANTDGNFLDPDFHILELGARQQIGNVSIGGWYWANFNDDIYFEATWDINDELSLVVGGGRGYYTDPYNFNKEWSLTNVGLWLQKEIRITEHYSQPVIGRLIYNPEADQIMMVFGFKFNNTQK